MKVFEETGQVIEFGTLEDTDGAPGLILQQKSGVIGVYISDEEKLKAMPNMYGKQVRITIEIIKNQELHDVV
jgi:hypothetical protein